MGSRSLQLVHRAAAASAAYASLITLVSALLRHVGRPLYENLGAEPLRTLFSLALCASSVFFASVFVLIWSSHRLHTAASMPTRLSTDASHSSELQPCRIHIAIASNLGSNDLRMMSQQICGEGIACPT
jgi:hypothetical protein